MKRFFAIILLLIYVPTALADSNLTTAGDALQLALPIAAFSTTLCFQDKAGGKEFLQNLGVAVGVAYILKYTMQSTAWGRRPNGGTNSFPSGHTTTAFQGAFFLQKRYGWNYGIIPIGLAALTGYSRVEGEYHHWRDVAGGAILAYAVNCLCVTKYCPVETMVYLDDESGILSIKKRF